MERQGRKVPISESRLFVDIASVDAHIDLGLERDTEAETVCLLNFVISEGMEQLAFEGRLSETGDIIALSDRPGRGLRRRAAPADPVAPSP